MLVMLGLKILYFPLFVMAQVEHLSALRIMSLNMSNYHPLMCTAFYFFYLHFLEGDDTCSNF